MSINQTTEDKTAPAASSDAELFDGLASLAKLYACRTDDGTPQERVERVCKEDVQDYFTTIFGTGPLLGEITTLPVKERVKGAGDRNWHTTVAGASEYVAQSVLNRAIHESDDNTAHAATTLCTFGNWKREKPHPGKIDSEGNLKRVATGDYITAAYGVIAELDHHPLDSLRKLLAAGLVPTMIIASGGLWRDGVRIETKLHCYFLFGAPATGEDIKRVGPISKRFAAFVGGDPTFCYPHHTIRIPGQLHRKDVARLSQIVDLGGTRYTLDALDRILNAVAPETKEQPKDKTKRKTAGERCEEWQDLLDRIYDGDDSHECFLRYSMQRIRFGRHADDVVAEIVEVLNRRPTGNPYTETYIASIVQSAVRKVQEAVEDDQMKEEGVAVLRARPSDDIWKAHRASVLARVSALTPASVAAGPIALDDLIADLALLRPDDVTFWVDLICEKIERKWKKDIRNKIEAAVGKALAFLKRQNSTTAAPEEGEAGAEMPDGLAGRCTRMRLEIEAANATDPTWFIRDDGTHMRVDWRGTRVSVGELDHSAWQYEVQARTGAEELLAAEVTILKGDPRWRLPLFESIAYVPVFSKNGTLRTQPGYDAATRTYLVPDLEIIPLPETVTDERVCWALRLILEEVGRDIPFSDSYEGGDPLPQYSDDYDESGWALPNYSRGTSSRAHWLAMIIQPFVRHLVDGNYPAFHVDKTTNGEGGTLITHAPAIVFSGEEMSAQPMHPEPGEFQKAMLATLRTGPAFVLFDNKNGRVDNGDLASAITTGKYTGRELGKSHMASCKVIGSFIFTGVGTDFSGELHRRMIPIRLDAGMEDPTKGREFKYDFDGHLKANRRELVHAVHILVLHWLQKGRPRGTRRLASFEAWSDVLGGILEAAGVEGFLETLPAYKEAGGGTERSGERDIVVALAEVFGGQSFGSAEILQLFPSRLKMHTLDGVGLKTGTDHDQANKNQLARYIKKYLAGRTWDLPGELAQRRFGTPTETAPETAPTTPATAPDTLPVVMRVVRKASPRSWELVPKA